MLIKLKNQAYPQNNNKLNINDASMCEVLPTWHEPHTSNKQAIMKRNILYSILYLALLFIISCTSADKEVIVFETVRFENELSITGEPIGPINAFLRSQKAIMIDSFLIVVDTERTPYAISLINSNNDSTVYHIAHKGQGPTELISATDIAADANNKRAFWAIDVMSQSYSMYLIDSIMAGNLKPIKRIKPRNHNLFMDDFVVTKDHIVCNGSISRAQVSFLSLKNGALEHESDKIPIEIEYPKSITDSHLSHAYTGSHAIKPDCSRIVAATSFGDYLSIYDSSGLLLKTLRTPEKLEPKFSAYPNGLVGYTETKYGYLDITCTNSYIFAQYAGKSHAGDIEYTSKFVHVFTWEGEPVARLLLDRYVLGICVDEQTNTLYALELYAEQPIIKYKLPSEILL